MYCAWDFIIFEEAIDISPQTELRSKESQVADLQENIKSQQAETSKAKDELTSALAAMEKLNENFKDEQEGWDT